MKASWDLIVDERRSLLDTFETLTPEQWETQSLCSSWTVRQLLGHLVVAADPGLRNFVGPVLRARGSFDTANDRLAREEAERPVDELLARYRERHTNRKPPPGLPLTAPLGDAMLHGLDLRVPLGLPLERPVERWEPVMGLLLSFRATAGFVKRGRPKVRWVATDHDWTAGSGDAVLGTMADLGAAASGRGARVEHLEGPGQPAVARWLRT
ncbi:MAG: maleylpyruvate isomerase family mycothiol-dependent enzyme [Acidimicrobiales bacterium]